MSAPKHTPGKWRAIASGCPMNPGQTLIVEFGEFAVIADADEPGPLEQMANADLIAAAPEMLKACKRLLEAMRNGDGEKLARATRIAQAAVLKAAHTLYLLPRKEQRAAIPEEIEDVFEDEESEEDEEDEEHPQEYILIVPGTPVQGTEKLHTMHPSSAAMCNTFLESQGKTLRWLPSVEILGGDDEPPLTDPFHQLANLDKPLTIGAALPAAIAPTEESEAGLSWVTAYQLDGGYTEARFGEEEPEDDGYGSWPPPSDVPCAFEDCNRDTLPGDVLCREHREAEDAERAHIDAEEAAHKAGTCGGNCFYCIDERRPPISEF